MNILCFGDSNTYGYRPDGSGRFGADTRWTGLLQKKLGTNDRIIEEGLCGRTTVFSDELREGRRGLDTIGILLESHAPVDLLILMLGTNDCKTRYNLPLPARLPRDWNRSSPKLRKVLPTLFVFS